jgi:hypothetical protein
MKQVFCNNMLSFFISNVTKKCYKTEKAPVTRSLY